MNALELKKENASIVFYPKDNGVCLKVDVHFEGKEITHEFPLTSEEYLTLANGILKICFADEHRKVVQLLDKDGK